MDSKIDTDEVQIRFDDLIHFLAAKRPNHRCPTCETLKPGWKFHTMPSAEGDPPSNPKMSIFRAPVSGYSTSNYFVEMVCIECSTCAHMNFIGVVAVQAYLSGRERESNE
ncbi:hypothetical protein [Pseudomonas viridiflava]|uniref:hypothetical protein n=1 Tax=Pseudomonas viridiflava TaxID=33069 RepID=UPI0013CE78AB|nr:hypothetical protein [Pseudomonas viridiflava]